LIHEAEELDDPDLSNPDPEISKRARKRVEAKKLAAKQKIESFFHSILTKDNEKR